MKYSLSMREIQRAESEGFPEGSGYISPNILSGELGCGSSINYTWSGKQY